MFLRTRLYLAVLVFLLVATVASSAQTRVGPQNGTLILSSLLDATPVESEVYKRFIELVGGPHQLIVIIPTARGAEKYDESYRLYSRLREVGATNLFLLHTYDKTVADSQRFVEPLHKARGVIIGGGDQTLLADAYLNTRTQRELSALLDRGGVIAGNSAGAMIMGSFLARGEKGLALESPTIMGDHVQGFGWLRDVVVLPHLLTFNRQFDLLRIKRLHPNLLGIGLDDPTAIIVQDNKFEIIGTGRVAIYDREPAVDPDGSFYFLGVGDSFNLLTREAVRGRDRVALPRVKKAQ
jgi:cyanophycinase